MRRYFPLQSPTSSAQGFTLAELLIALAILGIIAVFSIPKILQAQQGQKFNAISKEAINAVSTAYQAYRMENTPTSAMLPTDLLPYLNYIKSYTDGRTLVDRECDLGGPIACSNASPCLVMANGGVLQPVGWSFGGTTPQHTLYFRFDANGMYDNITSHNDTGSGVGILVYYDGHTTTRRDARPGSIDSAFASFDPDPDCEPPWFSWN